VRCIGFRQNQCILSVLAFFPKIPKNRILRALISLRKSLKLKSAEIKFWQDLKLLIFNQFINFLERLPAYLADALADLTEKGIRG
jgi:hypothetical protein